MKLIELSPYISPLLCLSLLTFVSSYAVVAQDAKTSANDPGCSSCQLDVSPSPANLSTTVRNVLSKAESETPDAGKLIAASKGRAVFYAPNTSMTTMASFQLLCAVRDKHKLRGFVIAVPDKSIAATNWVVRAKSEGLELIRTPVKSDDKTLPLIITSGRRKTITDDPIGPYFASRYYDHEKTK